MSDILLPGDAGFADVLAGKKFTSKNGYNVAGTMPNNGGIILTPSAAQQTIPLGYHDGTGKVPAVAVPAANVLTGTTIAGTAGTMPNRGAVTFTPSTTDQIISAGYHNGAGIVQGDSDLIPANILSGTNIFGVIGSLPYKKSANGTGTYKGTTPVGLTVTGLSFQPRVIFIEYSGGTANVRATYFASTLRSAFNNWSIWLTSSDTLNQANGNGVWAINASGFTYTGGTIWGTGDSNVSWWAWE